MLLPRRPAPTAAIPPFKPETRQRWIASGPPGGSIT